MLLFVITNSNLVIFTFLSNLLRLKGVIKLPSCIYKYLQIRNLVTILRKEGRLSLGSSEMEENLQSSTSL